MKDYIYHLEKKDVDKGKVSLVRPGTSISGDSLLVSREGQLITEPDFSDIKQGDMVLVKGRGFYNFIKTSPVSEIVDIAQDRLVFKTTSSTYVLTRTEEPEEFDEEELVA